MPKCDTRLAWRGLAGRQRPKMYFCLLRKLGGSGSPGPLQQHQQTKMLEKANISFNFGHLYL